MRTGVAWCRHFEQAPGLWDFPSPPALPAAKSPALLLFRTCLRIACDRFNKHRKPRQGESSFFHVRQKTGTNDPKKVHADSPVVHRTVLDAPSNLADRPPPRKTFSRFIPVRRPNPPTPLATFITKQLFLQKQEGLFGPRAPSLAARRPTGRRPVPSHGESALPPRRKKTLTGHKPGKYPYCPCKPSAI